MDVLELQIVDSSIPACPLLKIFSLNYQSHRPPTTANIHQPHGENVVRHHQTLGGAHS